MLTSSLLIKRIVGKLKESDIRRYDILVLISRIDTIVFFYTQLAKEHPFDGKKC